MHQSPKLRPARPRRSRPKGKRGRNGTRVARKQRERARRLGLRSEPPRAKGGAVPTGLRSEGARNERLSERREGGALKRDGEAGGAPGGERENRAREQRLGADSLD